MKCPHCGNDISYRPTSIMDLKDIIKAAREEMERLENCNAQLSPHGLVWNSNTARLEWRVLKEKIREANRAIAKLKL